MDAEKNTIGYELLFRDGPNNSFPDVDADLATMKLLSDHLLAPRQETIGELLGFINFPYQSLIDDVPGLFPAQYLVVEILEDCKPTDELFTTIKSLSERGYTIALDDFVPNDDWLPILRYINIIKFDIRTMPMEQAKAFIKQMSHSRIRFLAEKVETNEEFIAAKEAGFDYFQGYFFSKPELVQKKSLEPCLLTIIQLLVEVSKDEMDFDKIEKLISQDVTLSYNLLGYVNSISQISTKIQSFRQALIYLGEDRLRKFVSLAALAATDENKPDYLYALSIQRAKFCETLSLKLNAKPKPGHAFLTGMFSLLDSLLDRPIEDLIKAMPIDDNVQHALLEKRGNLGGLLALSQSLERANWNRVESISDKLRLDEEEVFRAYDVAIQWTSEVSEVID